MYRAKEGESSPAKHHIMKVADNEIRVCYMDIHRQCAKHQTGKSANAELYDEGEHKEKGNFKFNRSFVERRNPVKDLDSARN